MRENLALLALGIVALAFVLIAAGRVDPIDGITVALIGCVLAAVLTIPERY